MSDETIENSQHVSLQKFHQVAHGASSSGCKAWRAQGQGREGTRMQGQGTRAGGVCLECLRQRLRLSLVTAA